MIKIFENPMKKARVIQEAKSLVSTCIDEFWEGLNVPSDKLTLDADQFLSIVIYALAKAQIKDLAGHIKFIEEFTSPQVQNSKLGQSLYTLKAAT